MSVDEEGLWGRVVRRTFEARQGFASVCGECEAILITLPRQRSRHHIRTAPHGAKVRFAQITGRLVAIQTTGHGSTHLVLGVFLKKDSRGQYGIPTHRQGLGRSPAKVLPASYCGAPCRRTTRRASLNASRSDSTLLLRSVTALPQPPLTMRGSGAPSLLAFEARNSRLPFTTGRV